MSDLLQAARDLIEDFDAKNVIVNDTPRVRALRDAVRSAATVEADADLLALVNNLALTPVQLAVLKFIRDYIAEHNVSPTVQEIADHCGTSKVTAFEHLRNLSLKAIIDEIAGSIRAVDIEISIAGAATLAEAMLDGHIARVTVNTAAMELVGGAA